MTKSIIKTASLALILICGLSLSATAQQILIDKPVRAGELTLFPDLNNENIYYYIPDKARLATDANGRPQFSFLRYVENKRSGADQPEDREGDGGGIVHAVVSLSVTPEQLQEASRELKRLKPQAQVQGPVIYKSGRFGLVSSFKEANGAFTTKVLGLGVAPILDGGKAAVSIQLTKQGAKILWESFKTRTPDITFSFEMDLAGFRSPLRAEIEANFDQIYQHQSFGVGIASAYLAAEIKAAFDDLRRQGAIKVTQVGSDDKIEALITTAYNKLTDMMFNPSGGTGTPSLESLVGGGNSGAGLLDRASAMLARNREETRTENEAIRRENRENEENRRREEESRRAQTPGNQTTIATGNAAPGSQSTTTDQSTVASGNGATPPPAQGPMGYSRRPQNLGGEHANTAQPTDPPSGGSGTMPRQETATPSFAVIATYEMKSVRQRGVFKIDLNKYTADNLTLRFDENIGDLRSLMANNEHFREVSLDDPLFRQREIVATLDGLNAKDFDKFINFVTVHLRKQHASGEVTDDDERIDRANFNRQGNNFKLLYGWKGDRDRRRWSEYEYQTEWSFFGGHTVTGPWQKATAPAISLNPPYHRRTVELQADPDTIRAAEIRSITVKIYYELGGVEQVREATLNASKAQLSQAVEFVLPANEFNYQYEVVWQLKGNRTLTARRKTANGAVLFVDEPPSN